MDKKTWMEAGVMDGWITEGCAELWLDDESWMDGKEEYRWTREQIKGRIGNG